MQLRGGVAAPTVLKDSVFGVVLALAVALSSNLVQAIVHTSHNSSVAGKAWVVFYFAFGAVLMSLVLHGRRAPKQGSDSATHMYPMKLALTGIAGASVFLAVLGFGAKGGLGPGIGEILDSSLSPIFYIVWVIAFLKAASWNAKNRGGSVLIVVGLLLIGVGGLLEQKGPPAQLTFDGLILIAAGVVGALGSSLSIWLLRKLVRPLAAHVPADADLGFAVACRYGGVAVICLLIAASTGVASGNLSHPAWGYAFAAFVGGGVLVGGAFKTLKAINSESAIAGALALIPLFAFLVQTLFSPSGPLKLDWMPPPLIKVTSSYFMLGVLLAISGIVLLQQDSATKVS